jgi:hypothetical protein
VGLDLSLRQAAAVSIPLRWDLLGFDWKHVRSCVAGYSLEKNATAAEKVRRLAHIAEVITKFVNQQGNGAVGLGPARGIHVYMERYAFSRPHQAHQLGEVGGVVKLGLFQAGHVAESVNIQEGRKLLLGKVPRKDQKLITWQKVLEMGATFETQDEGDAFVVANFALSELGSPALSCA